MPHYWVSKPTIWIQNEEDVAYQSMVLLISSLMLEWTCIEYYYVPGTGLNALCVLFNPQQCYKVNRITVPILLRHKKLNNLTKKM